MPLDLKQTIRDRGLTQRVVAQRLGVSEPTVSHWLAHFRNPTRGYRLTAEMARALGQLINVHPHHLRPDVFDPPSAPSPTLEKAA